MVDSGIVAGGFILILFSFMISVAPIIFGMIVTFTSIEPNNLSILLVIGFFTGIAITIIGIRSNPSGEQTG